MIVDWGGGSYVGADGIAIYGGVVGGTVSPALVAPGVTLPAPGLIRTWPGLATLVMAGTLAQEPQQMAGALRIRRKITGAAVWSHQRGQLRGAIQIGKAGSVVLLLDDALDED